MTDNTENLEIMHYKHRVKETWANVIYTAQYLKEIKTFLLKMGSFLANEH